MKRAGIGIGAALVAMAAFANDPNQAEDPNQTADQQAVDQSQAADQSQPSDESQASDEGQENTQVAAVDAESTSFTQLDADTDGRISAIEASNDVRVASAFTTADEDKDGYLSQQEFRAVGDAQGQSASDQDSVESTSESETASESEVASEEPVEPQQ
jgi:hypothetical protein